MKPLYVPKGKAKEYGDYAVNIYTGCPHRCYYCFAPKVLHREKEAFHSCAWSRNDIVLELKETAEAGSNHRPARPSVFYLRPVSHRLRHSRHAGGHSGVKGVRKPRPDFDQGERD